MQFSKTRIAMAASLAALAFTNPAFAAECEALADLALENSAIKDVLNRKS